MYRDVFTNVDLGQAFALPEKVKPPTWLHKSIDSKKITLGRLPGQQSELVKLIAKYTNCRTEDKAPPILNIGPKVQLSKHAETALSKDKQRLENANADSEVEFRILVNSEALRNATGCLTRPGFFINARVFRAMMTC